MCSNTFFRGFIHYFPIKNLKVTHAMLSLYLDEILDICSALTYFKGSLLTTMPWAPQFSILRGPEISKKHFITAFFYIFQRYLAFSLRVGITSEVGTPSLIISLHQLMGNLLFKHSICLEIKNSRRLVDVCVHIF